MRIFNHIDVLVWLGIALAIANGPILWAESKTTSVTASCRVVQRLQVSSSSQTPRSKFMASRPYLPGQDNSPPNNSTRSELSLRLNDADIQAESNLRQGHHVANVSRRTSQGIQKIYTVTA